MSQPTYSAISQGIAATLKAAVGIAVVQEQLSLSESIADLPMIQVYMDTDEPIEAAERTTFGGGKQPPVRHNRSIWFADLYAHDRGEIGENIRDVYQYGQAVKDVLNAMIQGPFFGVEGISAYHWKAQRLQIDNAAQPYAAMRFTLTLHLY